MSTKKSFAARGVLFVVIWLIFIYGLALFWPQKTYFPFSYEQESISTYIPSRLWHLANFDGVHYQNIAKTSYLTRFQTAFFPLYPLLIRDVAVPFGGNLLVASLMISLATAIGSLYLLFRLGRSVWPTVWLLSFPTAFFLLASYTESLFLLLTLLTWWFYQKKRFLLAGLFGLLASLTRFQGVFLFPVLLLDYYLNKPRPKNIFPLLLIPAGLALYMAFLYFHFGDPFYFVHALSLWQKSKLTFPPQTVFRYLKIMFTVSPSLTVYRIALLELFAFLFGLSASLFLFIKKQFAYSFYLFLAMLLPALTGTFQSLPRYLLTLFPLYFIPEMIRMKSLSTWLLIIISLVLQLVLFTAFLTGTFVG